MTITEFENLEIVEQEEFIEHSAQFVQTQVIGQHICDFYKFNDFYVVFYYLYNINSVIHSKCLSDITGIKDFMSFLSRFQ